MPIDKEELLPVLVVALFEALEDSTILIVTISPMLLALGFINSSLNGPPSCHRDPSCFNAGSLSASLAILSISGFVSLILPAQPKKIIKKNEEKQMYIKNFDNFLYLQNILFNLRF
jgi:hypothetical protein